MCSRFPFDQTEKIPLEALIDALIGTDEAAMLANFGDVSAVHYDFWSEEEIARIDAAFSKLLC